MPRKGNAECSPVNQGEKATGAMHQVKLLPGEVVFPCMNNAYGRGGCAFPMEGLLTGKAEGPHSTARKGLFLLGLDYWSGL